MAWPPVTHQDVTDQINNALPAQYSPLRGMFPPMPLLANPAAATVAVAADQANLPHPTNTGTRLAFGSIAEPGRYDYMGDAGLPFTYTGWFGAPLLRSGTSKNSIGIQQTVFRCKTNASWLMLEANLTPGSTFDGLVQVRINGVLLTPTPQTFTGTYDGHVSGIDLTFPDSSYKTVEIFHAGYPYAINYSTGSTMAAFKPTGQKKLMIVGDSWINGTAQNAPHRSIASALQIRSTWDVSYNGQGGTGYVNGTANNYQSIYGSAERVTAVTDYQPDVLLVMGSINDTGLSGVQAAATSYYAAIASGSPNTKIIVVGPQYNYNDTPAIAASLQAAAAGASNVIGYVTPWVDGWDVAGVRGPGDLVHPSVTGAEWYADLLARTVRRFTVAAGDNSW